MFGAIFTGIARSFSASGNGPYFAAKVLTMAGAVLDDGGSIASPGAVTERDCLAQVDAATDAMRQAEGFVDTDCRLLIIDLTGGLDTDARVEVTAGPNSGTYSVQSVERDPLGVGFVCRGRPS